MQRAEIFCLHLLFIFIPFVFVILFHGLFVCLSVFFRMPVFTRWDNIYSYIYLCHNYNATIVWFGSQECHYRLSQSFDSLYERDELAINCEETYNDEKTTMNSNNSKHIAIQLEAKQLRRMAAQHTV